MVTKPSTEQTQDFSIHNEDFPALPGPNYKDTTLTNNEETKAVSVSHGSGLSVRVYHGYQSAHTPGFLCVQNLNSTSKSTTSADGPKFPGDKNSAQNNNQKKGIQVLPDGEASKPNASRCTLTAENNDSACASVPPLTRPVVAGRVTNIPSGMVTDQFGMIGLLTFIRAAETDPGMVHLALGSDLTTLGLNLNSPE